MIERGSNLVRRIESVLKEEIDLQIQYAATIEEEGRYVTKFNADKLTELSGRRSKLCEQIEISRLKREGLCREFPEGEGKRLTELAKQHCHRDDAKRINQLADKMRVLVVGNKRRGVEFGQITQFALNLISGSMSILWSATQSITKGYGRNGVVKETYTPKTRDQTTLEEV